MATHGQAHRRVRRNDEDSLPPGVCGRLEGIALVYGVVDSYGTRFKKGCLERSRQKVAAGKVGLFLDHTYGVDSHAGVLRSMEGRRMVVGGTERDVEWVRADLFDTPAGQRARTWAKAVTAAGGTAGQSIGFFDGSRRLAPGIRVRASQVVTDPVYGQVTEFTEIDLEELSLTPRPAVPGAGVTYVRVRPLAMVGERRRALQEADAILAGLPRRAASAVERRRAVREADAILAGRRARR